MHTYYVIWRGDEDEFFITRLELPVGMIDTLCNQQVVQMAFDAEYPDEPNPFVGDDAEPYDMIDIFSGDNITFHMK
jgi:hypothetical protein